MIGAIFLRKASKLGVQRDSRLTLPNFLTQMPSFRWGQKRWRKTLQRHYILRPNDDWRVFLPKPSTFRVQRDSHLALLNSLTRTPSLRWRQKRWRKKLQRQYILRLNDDWRHFLPKASKFGVQRDSRLTLPNFLTRTPSLRWRQKRWR